MRGAEVSQGILLDPPRPVVDGRPVMMPIPRPYQREALQAIQAAVDRGITRGLVVMPTGSGKTSVFAWLVEIFSELFGEDLEVLIIAHRAELLTQASDRISSLNPNLLVSIESGDQRATEGVEVVVASVQSIGRPGTTRLQWLRPKLIIIDEAHHAPADSYQNALRTFGGYSGEAFVLGVTATPHRLDNKPLHGTEQAIFEEVVYSYTLRQAIRDKWLCDLRGYRASSDGLDLSSVKTTAGDFNQGQLQRVMNTDPNNEIAFKSWQEIASDRKTIVFCSGVEHAEDVAAMFRDQGVAAAAVNGAMKTEDRERVIGRFVSDELQVLVNVDIATEGFDCLSSDTEILTESGWRGIGQVVLGERVYSLNRETEQLELAMATRVVDRDVNLGEKMFRIKSQHLDIRTTEGHEFHVKQRSKGLCRHKWYTKTGTELASRRAEFRLPIAAAVDDEAHGIGLPLSSDEIRFIAWVLTDGWMHRSTAYISQSECKHHGRIRALLKRLGFDFRERLREPREGAYTMDRSVYEFAVPKGNQAGKKARSGWWALLEYLDKDISPSLHLLSREQFKVLWEEMMLANGSRKNSDASGWLWMPRKSQADALTMMAAVRGFATACQPETTDHGETVWRITVRDRQWMKIYPNDPRAAVIETVNPEPSERVWCVTNKNSTLVTRRNGKVAIIGNCPPVSCILMLRPTQSWSLYQQMIGRGLRLFPGKADCLIIDIVGNSELHALGKQPSGGKVPVSLSGLVDLPPDLDLEGHSIMEALDLWDGLDEQAQATQFKRCTTFAGLTQKLQEVDLLEELAVPEEAAGVSSFAWLKVREGNYTVGCGGDTSEQHRKAVLACDALGAWRVTLSSTSREETVTLPGEDIQEAFERADAIIRREFPGAGAVANSSARWRSQPPTEKQIAWLKKKKVDPDTIAKLTKGTASAMLDRLMGKRGAK